MTATFITQTKFKPNNHSQARYGDVHAATQTTANNTIQYCSRIMQPWHSVCSTTIDQPISHMVLVQATICSSKAHINIGILWTKITVAKQQQVSSSDRF
jgi:hypothetical protein